MGSSAAAKADYPKWNLDSCFKSTNEIEITSNDDTVAVQKRMYISFLNNFGSDLLVIAGNSDINRPDKTVTIPASSYFLIHASEKLYETIDRMNDSLSKYSLNYHTYDERIVTAAFKLIYLKTCTVTPYLYKKFVDFIFLEWGLISLQNYCKLLSNDAYSKLQETDGRFNDSELDNYETIPRVRLTKQSLLNKRTSPEKRSSTEKTPSKRVCLFQPVAVISNDGTVIEQMERNEESSNGPHYEPISSDEGEKDSPSPAVTFVKKTYNTTDVSTTPMPTDFSVLISSTPKPQQADTSTTTTARSQLPQTTKKLVRPTSASTK